MRTALVQFAASTDPAANIQSLTDLLAPLTANQVDLVVLPEASMCDFGPPEFDVSQVGETFDGTFVQFLIDQARRLNANVVAGMFEQHDDRPLNTVVAVDPTGKLTAKYRKIHLFDSFGYRESDRFTPGNINPTVVTIGEQKWGLITCYDLRFPELARKLIDSGAEGLIVPAAWLAGPNKVRHWETLLAARAIENVCPVIGVGQSGPTYCANSQVVGALGEALAHAGESPGVTIVDIDTTQTAQARQKNPALEHRRIL